MSSKIPEKLKPLATKIGLGEEDERRARMKRSEYKKILKEIGLSKDQISKLRSVLEDLMTRAGRTANGLTTRIETDGSLTEEQRHRLECKQSFFEGRQTGLNTMDRFLRGDMDAHDEFDED